LCLLITIAVEKPTPASLITVHRYTPPSEPVTIGIDSKGSLAPLMIITCLLHSNILLGPPPALHVKLTVEFTVVLVSSGVIITLPNGDTTEKAHN